MADTLTLNRYTYVGCNPINFIDPSGYFWDSLVCAAKALNPIPGLSASEGGQIFWAGIQAGGAGTAAITYGAQLGAAGAAAAVAAPILVIGAGVAGYGAYRIWEEC